MRRKKNMLKLALIGILVVVLLMCIAISLSIQPMVRDLARAKVENHGQGIINEAIETQMDNGDVDYTSIVLFEKDIHGNVTALKTNIAEVNRLKTQTLARIDKMLLDMDVEEIGLPLGNLVLPTFFSGTGPKLPVKVLSISNSDAEFRNVFSEAGINQTAHQIMMDVLVDMVVLTPAGTDSVRVVSSVVVAETVIVGDVPQSYVNVGG